MTELKTIKKAGSRKVDVSVTRYWGGKAGTCYQLTALQEEGNVGYVQLSRKDIAELVKIIMAED